MKLAYLIFILSLFTGFLGCQNNNKSSQSKIDSLNSVTGNDSTILSYTNWVEKIKDSYQKSEGPTYTKGDYSFYAIVYKKDSLPVLYEEIAEAGNYGFTEKKYFLENGMLNFYQEKTKQLELSEGGENIFKEVRIYFRNDVFLKAEERKAQSDTLLKQAAFSPIDAGLIDKNKQYDLKRLEEAISGSASYNLLFDRVDSVSRSKVYLIMGNQNQNAFESIYKINKADSFILKVLQQPEAFKGRKIAVKFNRKGAEMVYESGSLVN